MQTRRSNYHERRDFLTKGRFESLCVSIEQRRGGEGEKYQVEGEWVRGGKDTESERFS